MPDIDIDFCQARRGEVIEYVTKKYGRENVAQIVTFSQLKPKLAVRDVARVLSLPVALGDRIAKLVPDGPDVNFERAFRDSPGLKEAMASDESIARVVKIAERLEGLSRHAGMHAAGVVIAPRPIIEFLPLYRTNKDEITTQFDMNAVEKMGLLKIDEAFASRYVNDGFSGGEKKRLEMLQMAVLEPKMAILDETDSGLDIDALRIVAEGVNAMLNPDMGVLLITHYQRLLNYITPDVVHVLALGRIVKTGGKDLALRLEDEGYGPILREEGYETDVPDEALLVPAEPAEVAG